MAVTLGRFVVDGTPQQVETIRVALANCTYPVADRLPRDIPVRFADLSAQGALGLFWTNGRIEIEQTLTADRAPGVFLSEAWHAVDQYILTNQDRAALQTVAHDHGPDGHTWFDNTSYYASLGETMMDVFLAAYTPYQASGLRWDHPVTQALVETLRRILGPAGPADPDTTLAAAVKVWLPGRHYRKNRVLQRALEAWLAAKGLT